MYSSCRVKALELSCLASLLSLPPSSLSVVTYPFTSACSRFLFTYICPKSQVLGHSQV